MSSTPLGFDDGTLQFVTEDGQIIFGPVRGPQEKILVFNTSDGTYKIDTRYDEYTPCASHVIQESTIFGIIGMLDISFARYVLVVTEKELAAKVKWRSIWRIRGVGTVQVYREDRLSLENEEHEKVV
jgi:hypothetical protein